MLSAVRTCSHVRPRHHACVPAGGFWATPLDYVLPFLGRHDMPMACQLLMDVVRSFRSHGINEWVGPFWPSATGAPGYTASAANVYAASKALRCESLQQ